MEKGYDLKEDLEFGAIGSLKKYYNELIEILKEVDVESIENVLNVLRNASDNGKTIYVIGNGGSASTAEHYVNDFMKIGGLKAVSLTNISVITALGNDISYEDIFVEQLKTVMSDGDVVIGITGSGNSMNIVKALEYVRDNKGVAVGILGFDGGKCLDVLRGENCNHVLIKSRDYGYVEDVHLSLSHCLSRNVNCREEDFDNVENSVTEEKSKIIEFDGIVEDKLSEKDKIEEENFENKSEKVESRGFGSWSNY